jgi:hypothetical protein
MKALSVIMPWPYLIMKCGKDVENRTWETKKRERILIHASKKSEDALAVGRIFNHFGLSLSEQHSYSSFSDWCGCIIGSVEIVDCVKDYDSKWAEPGLWHWVLKNPLLLKEPIPCRGSLGLWEYEGKIEYAG